MSKKQGHNKSDASLPAITTVNDNKIPRDIQLLMAEREAQEALLAIGAKYRCEIVTSYTINIQLKAIDKTVNE